MTLAFPWALLGLVPVAYLAWRLRRGAAGRVGVSSTLLWDEVATSARAPRRTRPPHWRVLLLLLAAALSFVAAAGPGRDGGTLAASVVEEVVEPARLAEARERLAEVVGRLGVDRVTGRGVAVRLTDDPARPGEVRVPPVTPPPAPLVEAAGLDRDGLLYVRVSAEVRLRLTDGGGTRVLLREAGDFVGRVTWGGSGDVVIEVEAQGRRAERVTLRRPVWPRLEAGADVPASVRRFVEAYARARPPVERSPTVRFGTGGEVRFVEPAGGASGDVTSRDFPPGEALEVKTALLGRVGGSGGRGGAVVDGEGFTLADVRSGVVTLAWTQDGTSAEALRFLEALVAWLSPEAESLHEAEAEVWPGGVFDAEASVGRLRPFVRRATWSAWLAALAAACVLAASWGKRGVASGRATGAGVASPAAAGGRAP